MGRGSPLNIWATNAFVVLAGGVLTGMVSGALICALAFIPLYDKPNYALRGLIATLAISLLGAQGLLWVFWAAREGAAEDLWGRHIQVRHGGGEL